MLQSYQPYFRFTDNVISLRRSDGSIVTTTIPPFSGSLLQYAAQSKWDQAIRLCRHVKVGYPTYSHHTEMNYSFRAKPPGQYLQAWPLLHKTFTPPKSHTAEKVKMLAEARTHSNKEVRNAIMVLLAGKVSEADSLLEKGGSVYRAVMLNIIMLRWSRYSLDFPYTLN
ncbi:hypothetical protein ANCDUO_11782 [Ancylostoma duodenale]|uniref:IFT80/172/WDR35 TPR domain-containing protein n=1 Tax=Ancylostoma duodenale TaxID=51022 RepID=A0A0C2D7D4_9BILA|nr:hypothetical protein ANCDUO_11782 [Ancylostoma duodenale]